MRLKVQRREGQEKNIRLLCQSLMYVVKEVDSMVARIIQL
jgi:hypothetical protein